MSQYKFVIFKKLVYFPKILILSASTTREATRILNSLYYICFVILHYVLVFKGFYLFYWILEKSFEVIKNIKKFRLEEAEPSYDQKSVYSDNPGQNIWNKNLVKLDRTRRLFYLILSILSLPLSNFNFWQEGYVPTQIWYFFIFSIS